MNKTTKPISSPGRTEKFPPPLMRFLRSNVGNKSRRRSRASPMFVKKKNTPFETTTQEPSSPKVTCIGQVRVRRSNKKNHKTTHNHRCRCLRYIKSLSLITVWSKWVMFFRCGSCNNSAKKEKQVQQKQELQQQEQEHQGEDEGHQQHIKEQENKNVGLEVDDINEGLIPKTPPKNAFLLTRCRSAPYRSSNTLANMFKESMVEKNVEQEVEEKIKRLKISKEVEEEEEDDDDEEGTSNESDGCEESKATPLILSRCKSEPARTWDQLLLL